MKFVALALAVFLAAGCQARFLQADAPSQYEHVRAAVVTYLGQVKETAQKAIDQIDDAEFKDYKVRLTQGLGEIEIMLIAASEFLSPIRESIGPHIVETLSGVRERVSHDLEELLARIRESIGPQIVETLSGVRERVAHDLEELHKELEPKHEELRQVLKKHLDEYREKLEPVLKEYSEKNTQRIQDFRTNVEPVIKELQEKLKVNVEETKSKLTPIVETIRNRLTKGLEELKATIAFLGMMPRGQTEDVFSELRNKYESGELQEKLKKLDEELRHQLQGIYNTIEKSIRS